MKVEILTIFYGQKHMELFLKTLLPSLLQPSNIPAMLESGVEVVHRIHCPPAEASALSLSLFADGYPITTEIVNTLDPNDHAGLSTPVKQSMERGVLTVMAPCDHVFGQGLWDAIRDLKPGDYLVCGHPRIELESGFGPMCDFVKGSFHDLNRTMVEFCMDKIAHPMVEHGKRRQEPYWFTIRREDHWETHFAEPPPLAWWGAPYMLRAWTGFILFTHWEVIDHEMVEHCRQAGTLKWIDDSRKFFWAEFTDHATYNPSRQPPLQSSFRYDAMKQMQALPLRWYFGSNPVEWRAVTAPEKHFSEK